MARYIKLIFFWHILSLPVSREACGIYTISIFRHDRSGIDIYIYIQLVLFSQACIDLRNDLSINDDNRHIASLLQYHGFQVIQHLRVLRAGTIRYRDPCRV